MVSLPTVSHSFYKCTLFLACLCRQHQRQTQSRRATRHVLFLTTDGDMCVPRRQNQIYFGRDIKNEETQSGPSGNPPHILQDPHSPQSPPSFPTDPLHPALTAWERGRSNNQTKTISGDLWGLCSNADQVSAGFFKYGKGISELETGISKEKTLLVFKEPCGDLIGI